MSWASFGVLNILCHYVEHAPRLVFSILTATITLVDELCTSRAVDLTSKGRGYYYDCFWLLDQHQMLWLIFVYRIESWVLICIRHVCRGNGSGVCIYTPSFFISFFIQNHSIHSFLVTFPSQKDFSLFLLHSSKILVSGREVSLGSCPFSSLKMYDARPLLESQF